MEATASGIHAYPLRPEGYAEPLFHCRESRREILEHFARSGWLWRASEQPGPWATSVAASRGDGRVVRVISRWREVDHWWEPGGGVDVVWCLVEVCGGRQEIRAEPVPGRSAA